MKKEEYAKMFREEQTHWFFASKRNFIKAFLHKEPIEEGSLILDAGCGTGANHLFMRNYGRVVSVDVSQEALSFCRRRSLRSLVHGDLNFLSFKNDSFDVAAALDVLYHAWIADDRALLKEFHRVLKPGGKLLITDSACPYLVSRHDQAVMTRERYTLPALVRKLEDAGFVIRRSSYMFTSTFPILAAVRLWQKYFHSGEAESNVFPLPGFLNQLLLKVMSWEASALRRARLPFGSSLILLAEKEPD